MMSQVLWGDANVSRKGWLDSVAHADGQFHDVRYNTSSGNPYNGRRNTMSYEWVTDFRREATEQISGVAVMEAAKQNSSEKLKPKGHSLGNGGGVLLLILSA